MPETTEQNVGGQGARAPEPIKAQLNKLKEKIAQFEAEKNEEKMAALEAFDAASDGAIASYPYTDLRTRWCEQQQEIESLYHQIVNAFPAPWKSWKDELIPTCVCANRDKVIAKEHQLQQQLEQQKKGGKGPNELARDLAKDNALAAKARIDALLTNPDKVATLLADNGTLIGTVRDLLKGPDPARALYPFWFRLVPDHQQLRPSDGTEKCMKFQTPEELCKKPIKEPSARPLPWLMKPEALLGALRDAWAASEQAATELATKEAAFQSAPDSVEAVTEQLAKLQGEIDGIIHECLKKATPAGTCCTTAGRVPNGANDA